MSNGEIICILVLILSALGITIYDVYLGVKEKDYSRFAFAFVSFAIFTVWTYDFIKKLYGL